MELTTVVLVIAVLATMLLGSMGTMRARAEKANCTANLHSLYIGAAAYVEQQGHWPQIDPGLLHNSPKQYAKEWIAALSTHGIGTKSWLCPTQQRALGGPDSEDEKNVRIDYNATPFDPRPRTPYLWAKQPWFVEHGSAHEGGPLLIYANGQVVTLSEAVGKRRRR